jgi:hypothetical protein
LSPSRFDFRTRIVLIRNALLNRLPLRTADSLELSLTVSSGIERGKTIDDGKG